MQRPFGLPLLLAAVVLADTAVASEQSRRLYSQGLVHFHAGRMHEALSTFDEAVAADPTDVYARYYRGVTRGRLNDLPGAIADLQAVAESHVVKQAPLELGVVLVEAGKYEEAIPWLEAAQKVPTLDARASLFLGIAQLRAGQTAAARRNFEHAETKDTSLRLPARYYRGIAAYQDGKFSEAQSAFEYVVAYEPDSDMGREAATFLRTIRNGEYSQWEIYGALGLQYDSNVVLAPSNGGLNDLSKQALNISNQADGVGVITLGGLYAPWRTEHTELSVGYEFYQSLHFQLTDFNLQDHRFNAQGVVTEDIYQFGLLGRYDYYFLGDENSFLQEVDGLPWFAVNESEIGRTEVFYRQRWRDFKQLAYDIRTAFNYGAGFRQLFSLGAPERYVSIGYFYDHESPTQEAGDVFSYDGNEVDAGAGWSFPLGINAEVVFAYRNEDYAPASMGRVDNEYQAIVNFYKQLTDYLAVTAGWYGDFNTSTQAEFEYTRNVGSISAELRFR